MRFEEAIKITGSRRALAELLSVSRQAVQQWAAKGELPELQVYKLRDLLNGKRPSRRHK